MKEIMMASVLWKRRINILKSNENDNIIKVMKRN